MKKIAVLLGTVFLNLGCLAQSPQLGIKGGLNISNLSYDNDYDGDARVGAHIGLLAHIPVDRQLALQPELVFSMQGAELGNEELQANYLNVPFLFQYLAGRGFRLETGPQVGVLLNAEWENGDGWDEDVEHRLKKTDLGWALGFSYLATSGLGVDARYNIGLTEVFKGRPDDVTNRVWQFGLFYQFKK